MSMPEVDGDEGALAPAEAFSDGTAGGGLRLEDIESDIQSLLASKDLRREAVEAMSETPEWKAYDQHVTFEMNLLRTRYVAGDEPLTNARRAQMSAHLKQVRESVMDEHLDAAAAAFVASASGEEKARLLGMLDALNAQGMDYDAAVAAVDEEVPKSPVSLQESMAQLSNLMADVESRAGGGGGAGATGVPDLEAALDELAAEMGHSSREELLRAAREGVDGSGPGKHGKAGRTGR